MCIPGHASSSNRRPVKSTYPELDRGGTLALDIRLAVKIQRPVRTVDIGAHYELQSIQSFALLIDLLDGGFSG